MKLEHGIKMLSGKVRESGEGSILDMEEGLKNSFGHVRYNSAINNQLAIPRIQLSLPTRRRETQLWITKI